jgi:hypothetical protein
LAKHKDDFIFRGQIRHLPKPEHWEKTLIPVKPETYQNGAYWGTASGWVAYTLWEKYPALSSVIISDLVDYYQHSGTFECINEDYQKLNNYVVTVTNPWGAINKMKRH